MKNIEILEIQNMASGNLCLELTDKVTWEQFPKYAKKLMKVLDGKIVSKNDRCGWGQSYTACCLTPHLLFKVMFVSILKYFHHLFDYQLIGRR